MKSPTSTTPRSDGPAKRHPCARSWRAVAVVALALAGACEIPELTRVDSPFQMEADSLPFPNFATGYNDSLLDAAGAQRMFGDVVCEEGSSPCSLTYPARAFVEEANLAMGGGRCEGFAVLAVLMSEGVVSPEDFGAPLARSLTLDDNPALQREIAYWFSTQLIPTAVADKTRGYSARDVLPVLINALAEDASERYRIGIVRKEGPVVTGGHALTPAGLYQDENSPEVYWVRVYDNNQPDFEKLLKLDILNNRWEFEASSNPSESSRLYYGDGSNNNPLWLAPILSRTGTHPCHFCDGNSTTVDSAGGAQISIELPEGGTAGLTEEGFEVADGVSVTPSFSAALDTEPLAMRISLSAERRQELADGVTTRITALTDPANPNARQRVRVADGKMTATAEQLLVTGEDILTARSTGVTYENNSRTAMNLKTQVTSGGRTLTVSVAMADGSDRIETDVDPDSGDVSVDVEGADGAAVTIQLEAESDEGEPLSQELTYVAGGESSFSANTSAWTAGGGDVTASVSNDGAPAQALTGGCFDSVQGGSESDVDCGGGCERKCEISQGCTSGDDCASGYCDASDGVCVESSCVDGVQSGDETGVDCGGGTCAGCGLGEACEESSDCAPGSACDQSVCVETFAVGVTVTGLSVVDTMVLQNNGADDLTITADGSYTFPTRVFDAYDVTILEAPEVSACTVSGGTGVATGDVIVTVTCTDGYTIGGTLSGLPAGESVTLSSGDAILTVSADGEWTFADKTLDRYSVQVVTQPASKACTVYRGSGRASANVTDILVQCCEPGLTGEGCDACFPGHGSAPPQCSVPACGDGILDPGESCDDADTADDDGCSASCDIEPGYTCANPVQVNTGSDNTGGRAAIGSDDLVWSWSETRDGPRTPATVAGNCAPGQWVDAGAYAEWVNRYGCGTPSPFGNTTWYHATFTIPTADAAAATSVSGTVWADNRIEDIFVNGVSTAVQSPDTTGFQGAGLSFGAWPSSLYQAGENTISVAVENLGTTPNPDGLLVQVPNAFGTGSVCTQ